MNIDKASMALSEIAVQVSEGHLALDVKWFRAMTKENQWHIERHRHTTYELHFVAQGDSVVTTDAGEFYVSAGQMFITPPGVYHAQHSARNKKYVEYCLNCDITLNDSHASEAKTILDVLATAECRPISGVDELLVAFESAMTEALNKHLGFQMMIANTVKQILVQTARVLDQTASYQSKEQFYSTDYRMIAIDTYLKKRKGSVVSVTELAKALHVSTKQITRIVKKHRNMTAKEYMLAIKLDEARFALANTDSSVTKLSETLGFSSVYYFDQFFKKQAGVTPTEYRKMSENIKIKS